MGKTMIIIHRRGCPLNFSNYISPYIGSHVDLKKNTMSFRRFPVLLPSGFQQSYVRVAQDLVVVEQEGLQLLAFQRTPKSSPV